jgi:ABC-type transport system involved in multi-copper enzyme maturation permease subunit
VRRIQRALWNPIVAKEYRSRMRTFRSPLALTLYVLLLGGLGWAVFSALASEAQISGNAGSGANYGQNLFIFLVIFQMVLLTFIVPALTAGTISGERERQTIDLLFCTRVPPFAILWGKLLASMSFVLLLLLSAVPIFSLVFLFGGIELDQLLIAFLVTVVSALTLGMLGVLASTLSRRTLPATVAAYGAAFLLVFGTLAWGLLFPTTLPTNATRPAAAPAVTFASPITGLVWIASQDGLGANYGIRYPNGPVFYGSAGGGGVVCPAGPNSSCAVVQPLVKGAPVGRGTGIVITPTPGTSTAIPSGPFSGWQYWQATIFLEALLAVVALVISAYLLPPVRPFRRRRVALQPAV